MSQLFSYRTAFSLLEHFDAGKLVNMPDHREYHLSVAHVRDAIQEMRASLAKERALPSVFAREVPHKVEALVENLNQTLFGTPAFLSVEEKAAHLLYYFVKDHPFIDGNKRCGVYLFADFLNAAGLLMDEKGRQRIDELTLAALVVLVAISPAQNKNDIVAFIVNVINLSLAPI